MESVIREHSAEVRIVQLGNTVAILQTANALQVEVATQIQEPVIIMEYVKKGRHKKGAHMTARMGAIEVVFAIRQMEKITAVVLKIAKMNGEEDKILVQCNGYHLITQHSQHNRGMVT